MNSDDDDDLKLNPSTLSALAEFMKEQEELKKQFEQLKSDSEDRFKKLGLEIFKEDWQLSQFWYDENTQKFLLDKLYQRFNLNKTKIGIISAPSVHVYLHKHREDYSVDFIDSVYCFEFDTRFDVLPNFIKYDYNDITGIDTDKLKDQFGIFLIDPPFLSQECFQKVQSFVQLLQDKNNQSDIIVCSGAVMANTVKDLFGVESTSFHPTHASPLSNEFKCYSNFDF